MPPILGFLVGEHIALYSKNQKIGQHNSIGPAHGVPVARWLSYLIARPIYQVPLEEIGLLPAITLGHDVQPSGMWSHQNARSHTPQR